MLNHANDNVLGWRAHDMILQRHISMLAAISCADEADAALDFLSRPQIVGFLAYPYDQKLRQKMGIIAARYRRA